MSEPEFVKIDREKETITVTVTFELIRDLRRIVGLDPEEELMRIISHAILTEVGNVFKNKKEDNE